MILIFALVCGVLINGLNSFGFVASAKIYFLLISLFIAFVSTAGTAAFTLITFTTIYFVFGVMYSLVISDHQVDINSYVNHYTTWLMELVRIALYHIDQLRRMNSKERLRFT